MSPDGTKQRPRGLETEQAHRGRQRSKQRRAIHHAVTFGLGSSTGSLEKGRHMNEAIRNTIVEIIAETGRLPVAVETLTHDADLYQAGLTSFASVQLMLAIEDRFGVEFPDRYLNRRSFASIDAIGQV